MDNPITIDGSCTNVKYDNVRFATINALQALRGSAHRIETSVRVLYEFAYPDWRESRFTFLGVPVLVNFDVPDDEIRVVNEKGTVVAIINNLERHQPRTRT